MSDRILLCYIGLDLLFLLSGVLLLVFSLTTQSQMTKTPTVQDVAHNLLLMETPLSAGIGNAVLIFVTFVLSLPALVMPTTRGWLKLHGYMVVVCALFTMIIGLDIWFDTLKTRANLLTIWSAQPSTTQSLLQQELVCCGYTNSTSPPFVVDTTCPNAQVAASMVGCITPFSKLANNFLDLIFTGAFGIVGIDVVLILGVAIVLKDRKEKARYRVIDEKNGAGAF
jgi:hypothetical protein